MATVGRSKKNPAGFFPVFSFAAASAFMLLMACASAARAADCDAPLARLVLVKGDVELVRQGSNRLTVADSSASLCAGDTVVVHPRGQAALLLSNATLVRLDQSTTVTLSPSSGERPALLNVVSGAIYVISRTPRPFRVKTPFINANVEGTEFLVEARRRVDAPGDPCSAEPADSNADRISVYEGRVRVEASPEPILVGAGEAAVASATQGPTKVLVVRPRDAVVWTLYIPSVLPFGAALPAAVACAAKFLSAGRLDDAKKALAASLTASVTSRDSAEAAVLAVLATIAVAENDRDGAAAYADRAVALNPASAAAWLARSYAQQARFAIQEALVSGRRATEVEPANALAFARRAELEMSVGRLDEALLSAQTAARLDPKLDRTQTVLGFASLTRFDMGAARASFERAIALDGTDPLPRLGLGLTRIRDGQLAGGRAEIELAAVLDPTQSLLRSYLGKAYYDEKRSKLAAGQLELAKTLDPNDPTPWLYDSLRKSGDNQPIAAVEDILESIRLNDRRAVYRSRLLLDEDLATRDASLARSFLEIDLRESALAQAATSLAIDPGSSSAHRFLSDASADSPRHEITRASELLQAQLRQPLSVTPLQAQLSNDRLFSLPSEGANALGLNEFGSLFLANGSNVQLHGLVGNQRTNGEQGIYSLVRDNIGFGASALHFATDGSRPNADSAESSQNAFVQVGASPSTTAQLEITHQRRDYGDIVSRFNPQSSSPAERNAVRADELRFGLRHSFGPSSEILVSLNRRTDRTTDDFTGGFVIDVKNVTHRAELQHVFRTPSLSVVSGASYFQGKTSENVFGTAIDSRPEHLNAYAYATYALVSDKLYGEVGLSYDHLKSRDSGDEHRVNPKLGLIWHPGVETTVRAAFFRVVKRKINADAGLEPTQVAGFDQYYDDNNGSKSSGGALAADFKPYATMRAGVSLSRRNVDVPLITGAESVEFSGYREREGGAYVHWTLGKVATLGVRIRHSRYVRTEDSVGDEGFSIVDTTQVPVSLNVFGPRGLWSSLVVTHVNQHGRFNDENFNLVDGASRFRVVNAAVGYRFAQRRGIASIEAANLFDKSFRFQDIGLEGAQFSPRRTLRLRLSLNL
jgi:tetratricopeptide (TPR) repeat protein